MMPALTSCVYPYAALGVVIVLLMVWRV